MRILCFILAGLTLVGGLPSALAGADQPKGFDMFDCAEGSDVDIIQPAQTPMPPPSS